MNTEQPQESSSPTKEVAIPENKPYGAQELITQEMIDEERKLQEQGEEAQERLREAATEEYEKMLAKQRLLRFNDLLGKTSLFTNFLTQRLEAQKAQKASAREKAAGSGRAAKKRKVMQDDQTGEESSEEATKVEKDEDQEVEIEDDEETEERQRRIRQPKILTGGVLREYQLQGFEWLVSLYENGLNGILGDEMGLGKTVQCIALIAHLIEKNVAGPFLIVTPLSTLGNWISEFERFAPSIPVVLYHGTPDERAKLRARKLKKGEKKLVIVTTYELVMHDRKFLCKHQWKYIVVDEGHRLKNLNCRLIKDLKSLPSSNRLLLTGTPLQNKLSELWSLLNFLLPQLFDDVDFFQSWFDFSEFLPNDPQQPLGEDTKLTILAQLHQILKPFLLRRLKCDVEKYLPKKREYLVYAPLTPKQHQYYDAILRNDLRNVLLNSTGDQSPQTELLANQEESTEERVKRSARGKGKGRERPDYKEMTDREYFKKLQDLAELEEEGKDSLLPGVDPVMGERIAKERLIQSLKLQNIVMQLRKVCNHPYLFDHPVDENGDLRIDEEIVRSCGKLLLLDTLVPALIARGHKLIIFSQMTNMLDLLGDYFTLRNLEYCRIDGSVPYEERQTQIMQFNSNESLKVFLLSTRAGGLGINLTAADTCIIYDSDWNPQMDLQAQDRVHRIGQTKPVIVYRLCTAKSLESVMLEKANAKRKLEKIVIHKKQFKRIDTETASLQLAELAEILRSEDGEKVDLGNPSNVISDEDLERILDRSEEAFHSKHAGKGFSVYDARQTGMDSFQQIE